MSEERVDLTEICEYIKNNYSELEKSTIEKKELVIFATGNFDGEYGYGSSDLNSYGVDKEGKLYWAFASGCSCYCSADTEEKTVKIIEIGDFYQDFIEGIKKALTLFNEDKNKFKESIDSHNYDAY